jgi:hypothetical protein
LLKTAVLSSIAHRINKDVNSIPVRERHSVTLNGTQWEYVEFEVEFEGTKAIFGDYYQTFNPTGVVQLLFWASPPLFDAGKAEIETVAASLKTDMAVAN